MTGVTVVCEIEVRGPGSAACGLPSPAGRCARCGRPFCLSHRTIARAQAGRPQPIGPSTVCTTCHAATPQQQWKQREAEATKWLLSGSHSAAFRDAGMPIVVEGGKRFFIVGLVPWTWRAPLGRDDFETVRAAEMTGLLVDYSRYQSNFGLGILARGASGRWQMLDNDPRKSLFIHFQVLRARLETVLQSGRPFSGPS